MALTDQPYLPLYVNQWLSNKKLKFCTPAAHGIMINIMALMHKEDEYGVILLEQMFKLTDDQITNFALQVAKLTAFDSMEIAVPLAELVQKKVLRIDGEKLICNRMVNDASISKTRASVGSEGGKTTQNNYKLAKANLQANTVNEIVIVNKEEINMEEGMEETGLPKIDPKPVYWNDPIVQGVKALHKKHFMDDIEMPNDNENFRKIIVHVCKKINLPEHSWEQDAKNKVLNFINALFEWGSQDPWFSGKQLSFLTNNIGTFIKEYKKHKIDENGKHTGNSKESMGKDFVSTPL